MWECQVSSDDPRVELGGYCPQIMPVDDHFACQLIFFSCCPMVARHIVDDDLFTRQTTFSSHWWVGIAPPVFFHLQSSLIAAALLSIYYSGHFCDHVPHKLSPQMPNPVNSLMLSVYPIVFHVFPGGYCEVVSVFSTPNIRVALM